MAPLRVSRSAHNTGRASRRHASKAEKNKIETHRNSVGIDHRIQIKGMGLDDGNDGIEAREGKSNEEINAYRAEDRFRGGIFERKNAAKDNYNNENIECEAENDGQGRRWNHPGVKNDRMLRNCGNSKNQSDKDETSAEAHRVYGHQCDGGAEHTEHVITHAAVAHVRVESQI
jgi:hypothetical protein